MGMRSADLRARLVRVVDHGERSPEARPVEGDVARSWRFLIPVAMVLAGVVVATWHAGHESGQFEGQRLSAQINLLTQQIAPTQLDLDRQKKRTSELEAALKASGKNPELGLLHQLRQQLSLAQAEANQYKSIIAREQELSAENQRVIDALSTSGARLFPMKVSDAAADSTVYALLVENARLLIIASKLPKLAGGKQFQLWVVRKQDPKVVSAGVFSADGNRRAMMNFDEGSVLSEVALLEVTEEPEGGSSEPTGAKLMEIGVSERIDRSE